MHPTPPPPWPICFGLETELGITVMEDPEADVVEESIALVRSAAQHGVANLWDYASEDPHRDARGFRVQELLQDTDEAGYYSQDAARELTFQEIKSDLVLRNGARFYNDHAHPEYSTPECATLVDLIAQDKAGERLLEECARQVTRRGSRTVKLYKNNTDFRGHSYGCHDNYLIPRVIPWERLVQAMTPFLVTRQLYGGAGKVGWECENTGGAGGFQISQRADFFSELVSIDTMNRRPLINTRDEPHADPTRFRRFHVIIGDSNLSQFATWLKIGTTALMLESLEHEGAPEWWSLADPLEAHRTISRDESYQWNVPLANGKTIRAVDLQYEFIRWVEKRVDLEHPEKHKVLQDWKETVQTLEKDPLSLRDRLDRAAKRQLLDAFRQQEGLEWDNPWLQSLDLEYHLLKHDEGLFFALENSGDMKRLIGEAEIIHAVQHPPDSSRAYLRGRSVLKFAREMKTAQWDNLVFKVGDQMYRLDMSQAFPGLRLEEMITAMDKSKTIQDLIRELNLKPYNELMIAVESSKAKRISPMLAVADMNETLSFYKEVLGFSPVMESPGYSILELDGQTIHFQKAESEKVMECVRGHAEIYIEMSGIESLWEHVKTFKDRYKIRDLFMQDYGMTEFHIGDPNGCLIFVGERTTK